MRTTRLFQISLLVLVVMLMSGIMTATSETILAQGPQGVPDQLASDIKALQKLILVAQEKEPADLLVEDVTMYDVNTGQWLKNQDIMIAAGRVAGFDDHGKWKGQAKQKIDGAGKYAVPCFGESHKHGESTHLTPENEAMLDLPLGSCWINEDSHEIGNVSSAYNMEYWLRAQRKGSAFRYFPTIGSAIPPTPMEITGGFENPEQIAKDMANYPWVTGYGEMMDHPNVEDPGMPGYKWTWDNIAAIKKAKGVIEGHGSGVTTVKDINAFAVFASSDHSVANGEEGYKKMQRGLQLDLKPNVTPAVIEYLLKMGVKDWRMVTLTTDDRSVGDSLALGTADYNFATGVQAGMPLEAALNAVSFNIAQHLHIEEEVGSITPGVYADIILMRSLPKKDPNYEIGKSTGDVRKAIGLDVYQVIASGRLVAQEGKLLPAEEKLLTELAKEPYKPLLESVNFGRVIKAEEFAIKAPVQNGTATAVLLKQNTPYPAVPITATVQVKDGVVQIPAGKSKFCIADRYTKPAKVNCMLLTDSGPLTPGLAAAFTVAHDHHDVGVYTNDDASAAVAVNELAKQNGGYILVKDGKVVARLVLEVGGLMSARLPAVVAAEELKYWDEAAKFEWVGGVAGAKRFLFAPLSCTPRYNQMMMATVACPSGFWDLRKAKCLQVVW